MGWGKQSRLAIGLLYSSTLLAGAEAITVHLYDYAGLSEATLTKAERETSRIYRHSGVEVSWMECAAEGVQGTSLTVCDPATAGTAISVSILPPDMEGRMRESAGLVGRGPVSGIAVGAHAYVFLHRVVEICDSGKYPQEIILGVLIAHEVGHVLLGSNSHWPQGIMSAKLSSADLRLALDDLLFFDEKQAATMRDRLAAQRVAKR